MNETVIHPVSDEPTAIRSEPTFRWHAKRSGRQGRYWTTCGKRVEDMTERVPLSQTATEDRCKVCWPTQQEPR